MTFVHLNGRLVREEEARISPFDRGFLLGDAVFETMRVYRGRPHDLAGHLARLQRSCRETRIPFPEGLPAAIDAVVAANGHEEASVRITLTRGPGGRGASPRGAGPPTVLVTSSAVHHPPEIYAQGLRLVTARRRRIPGTSLDPGIKTTNYLVHVLARIEAEEAGADDALFTDEDGFVVEATQANVFAVLGDALVTPPLSSGCLPGEARADVLALAAEVGLRAFERPLAREELLEASEVLLTASVLEVAPVVELDGTRVGDGRPGPAQRRLHALYRKRAQGLG